VFRYGIGCTNSAADRALRVFPTFRTSVKGKDGAWGPLWLWDGEREWQVGRLKPGMETLPPPRAGQEQPPRSDRFRVGYQVRKPCHRYFAPTTASPCNDPKPFYCPSAD
jgi:hypothetical protein